MYKRVRNAEFKKAVKSKLMNEIFCAMEGRVVIFIIPPLIFVQILQHSNKKQKIPQTNLNKALIGCFYQRKLTI